MKRCPCYRIVVIRWNTQTVESYQAPTKCTLTFLEKVFLKWRAICSARLVAIRHSGISWKSRFGHRVFTFTLIFIRVQLVRTADQWVWGLSRINSITHNGICSWFPGYTSPTWLKVKHHGSNLGKTTLPCGSLPPALELGRHHARSLSENIKMMLFTDMVRPHIPKKNILSPFW